MRRAKITQLPKELREWIDSTLIARNFSGYEQFTAEANAKLAESGYQFTFGKSAAQRYGSQLERRIAAIKASTEAAVLINDAAPDDEDKRSGAVVSMTQTGLFNILVDLEEGAAAGDPMARAKLLSTVAKNVATLTRASVNLKRYQTEVRGRITAVVGELAQAKGMTDKEAKKWREKFLGVAERAAEQRA